MPLGLIKRLMVDKGFGFILPSDGGADVFFHCSKFSGGEFDRLKENQAVSYEIDPEAGPSDRGPKAKSVVLYHGHVTFTGGDQEFRPLRRHPSARRKKPGWRNGVE
jgi:CspA family cold shock protein